MICDSYQFGYPRTVTQMRGEHWMTKVTDKTFGRRVRAIREKYDKTLQEVADEIGMSRAHLSRLESGSRTWNLESQEKVAALFGVSLPLLQDESIPLDRLDQVAEFLRGISDMPDEQVEALLQLLRTMQSSQR